MQTNALMESMKKLRQNQKRMDARLSNQSIVDEVARYMVSILKKSPSPRM